MKLVFFTETSSLFNTFQESLLVFKEKDYAHTILIFKYSLNKLK